VIKNIKYNYGIDEAGNKKLLGVVAMEYKDGDVVKHEAYVGIKYSLEDILLMENFLDNKHIIKLTNTCKLLNASGIIFFPQVNEYAILEDKDVVLPYNTEENNVMTLQKFAKAYEADLSVHSLGHYDTLDDEDSLLELNDVVRTRVRPSER
jgi:hypothetical protein